jgi:hypothetical protein
MLLAAQAADRRVLIVNSEQSLQARYDSKKDVCRATSASEKSDKPAGSLMFEVFHVPTQPDLGLGFITVHSAGLQSSFSIRVQ